MNRGARGYDRVRLPVLVGHRGSRTRFTENTLDAITLAKEQGAQGVEIDVRPCASGEIVVMHDETLERVTGQRDERAIASLTHAALREVVLSGGARVPLLEEVLELCGASDLLLNVELKRDVPSRIRATVATAAVLRRSRFASHVVVSSFDPFMLSGIAALVPSIERALLLEPRHRGVEAVAGVLRARAIHPHKGLVSASSVGRWHARGLYVVPWTVNDVDEATRLLTLGADGIITDDPALLRPLFD